MKIAFISRSSEKDKLSEDLEKLLREEVAKVTGHDVRAYITARFEKEYYIDSLQVKIIKPEDDPISPVSINSVLSYIKTNTAEYTPDTFLICSKEVGLEKDNIETLIEEIDSNPWLLAVGYKLKIPDNEKLDNELQGYYANKKLIAYRVPWNTCAIWKYRLFDKYVEKFDEITLGKYPFNDITVTIDGVSKTTQHKGMEDGLAIAQAVSRSKDIRFKLLKEPLTWTVNKTEEHRQKLARKEYVMRNFMAVRNYSVEDLGAAEVK